MKVAHTYHFKKFSNRCRYGKPLATVNGSNSAGNKAIEIPHGESAPIGCSASILWACSLTARILGLHPGDEVSITSRSSLI